MLDQRSSKKKEVSSTDLPVPRLPSEWSTPKANAVGVWLSPPPLLPVVAVAVGVAVVVKKVKK